MTRLEFQTEIACKPQTLWHCLWEPENYKKWTSVFCAGSYYQTEQFAQGSRIHLLTPEGDGMYSIIDRLEENHILVFRHLGELKNFEEQQMKEDQEVWGNALESYEITPTENGVKLTVLVDTADKYLAFMNDIFVKSMQILKEMAESEQKTKTSP